MILAYSGEGDGARLRQKGEDKGQIVINGAHRRVVVPEMQAETGAETE